MILYQRIDIEP